MMLPTPTPFPTPLPATPAFSFGTMDNGINTTFAQGIVQGYNQMNSYGTLDILFTVMIILLVLGGIFWIVRALQDFADD